MVQKNRKWNRSDFLRLQSMRHHPESGRLWVKFEDGIAGELAVDELWKNRPGKPDWSRAAIHPQRKSVLLVPTLPGHPTFEGETAEIPSDVIRVAIDDEFHAYIESLARKSARQVGRQLTRLRKDRGLSREAIAEAAGLGLDTLVQMETGQIDPSTSQINRVLSALGASQKDLYAKRRAAAD